MDSQERIHVFLDESGAYGYNFENEGCSTHYIISAILVKESMLDIAKAQAEIIRSKHFGQGEIKSKNVRHKNYKRRKDIYDEILKLPFVTYIFIVDKRKIFGEGLIKSRKSFDKFLAQKVYHELNTSIPNLEFHNDGTGSKTFEAEFISYAKQRNSYSSLFDNFNIKLEDSKTSVLIQIADFISGCVALTVDEKRKVFSNGIDYLKLIEKKILKVNYFPSTHKQFLENATFDSETDRTVAITCCRKVETFIAENEKSKDSNIAQQVAILRYLIFRFYDNHYRKYIATNELIKHLNSLGYKKMQNQNFRNKIIAPLRDKGIVIASSKNGYKIPAKLDEVYDFLNHGISIAVPILSRLNKCCEVIKIGSNGDIDILNDTNNSNLNNLLSGLS